MEERRRSPRHRALKGARIVFNHGASSLSCLVRNLAEGGARLEVESSLGVPNRFLLYFDDGDPSRTCEVRWRTQRAIGVAFAGPSDLRAD
ncbi:MAG: PilZ domain-containing protein [Rhizobiales bacterium]|nr:PilZ domain-containing protein [Hyphomicrobiales bacterium]